MARYARRKGEGALLVALASGLTVREAAAQAHISEKTARRRVADTDFNRRGPELRADMMSRSLGKLSAGMTQAADTLCDLLTAQSEGIRLAAARGILEMHTDRKSK